MIRRLFAIEHGKAAYSADFVLYLSAVVAIAALLFGAAPPGRWLASVSLATLGICGWTLIEYLLHRFVLHGVVPFKAWHEEHHRRPTALICAPTILSASLVFILIFLPSWALGDVWDACALTLGMVTGYLLYAITHHATHHWRARNMWLANRKRWHALHHHHAGELGGYGVTTAFWDHVFGSVPPVALARTQEGGTVRLPERRT
jgi:sterol desaturase/sphingolipid hydroxylase (fatty acid hydroxylase superfamily)